MFGYDKVNFESKKEMRVITQDMRFKMQSVIKYISRRKIESYI